MHDRLKVMACQVMDVHRLRGHMSTFISAAISHCQAAICGGRFELHSAVGFESGSYYEHKEAEVRPYSREGMASLTDRRD